MITLNTPPAVTSVLGGTDTVSYDKFVLSSITYDPVNQTVNAQVRITSTAQQDMQPITGSMSVNRATGKLEIAVQQLDFYRRVALSGAQSTALEDHIRSTQHTLENSLITLGMVAGTQSAGT